MNKIVKKKKLTKKGKFKLGMRYDWYNLLINFISELIKKPWE